MTTKTPNKRPAAPKAKKQTAATLDDLDWDDLRVLCALFRESGARSAAQRLGLDRATVVRRLARAERVLGRRLFLRTRDGLRASPAGTALWPRLKKIEESVGGLVDESDVDVAGVVTVACTEGFAPWLLDQGLLEALAPWPALSLRLLAGNAPVAVEVAEADVAVRIGVVEGDGLLVRKAARLGLAAFCAPAYAAARGRAASVDDFKDHDVLVPDGELARLPEARLLRAGRVRFSSSSLPALAMACGRGLGITVLTRAWGDRVGLERLFDLALPPRPVSLVLNAESRERPAVRVVVDVLLRLAGRLSDPG